MSVERLTLEQLRAWLDRKPPEAEPVDERPWEEFELLRVVLERDVQMEAGHA